jgi:hypothetical protein
MLFPPSTNAGYRGAPVAAYGLVLAGLLELIPGLIHYFLPDGGAGVIAGLDLGTRRQTIIALFAWFGSVQIPFALLLIVIGLRYRTLVPLGLLAFVLARLLMAVDGWFGKGSGGGHHPPEHYASPAAVMIGLLLLALALRPREKER